jgi:hypothetical protein
MALPMCHICGACRNCNHDEDYVKMELPSLGRVVWICKCCIAAIKTQRLLSTASP